MELGFTYFSTFLALLLCFFTALKITKRFKTSDTALNLPPGPWKLPIFGNLPHLIGSPIHRKLRDLAQKYGPLMHLQLGEISTIVVSSPEWAKEVMKNHDVIFASRPPILVMKIIFYDYIDIAFSPYGDYWRQLRKICTLELLSAKRVRSFRSIREEEVSDLIYWINSKAGSVINLTEKVHSLMSAITARAAFGDKCKEQALFISLIDEISTAGAGFNIADLFPSIELLKSITGIKSRLKRLHKEIDRIAESILNEHKKGKSQVDEDLVKKEKSQVDEDLVDVLLKVQEHGELPFATDNIKAIIIDIFLAGSETSATTIDWAFSEMMKNPRVMKKAQAEVREVLDRKGKVDETGIDEMEFLKLVIKETLRLHSPVPLLVPRECSQSCEINGFSIPVKARVVINSWAMGRDPTYWTEPESFIPERFLDCGVDYKGNNFEYIPFGAGRRICPGMSFGLANVELPLAMLLYHFDWKLPSGEKHEDLNMTEVFGLAVRRKDDLKIIPTPYYPSPSM